MRRWLARQFRNWKSAVGAVPYLVGTTVVVLAVGVLIGMSAVRGRQGKWVERQPCSLCEQPVEVDGQNAFVFHKTCWEKSGQANGICPGNAPHDLDTGGKRPLDGQTVDRDRYGSPNTGDSFGSVVGGY